MGYVDYLLRLATDFENEALDLGLVEDPAKRKERYLIEQEIRKTNPEAMEKHREGLKERQRKWYERVDPEKLQQLEEKKWEQKKQQMRSNTLEGLSVKLRQQIADTKTNLSRNIDPTKLSSFERIVPRLYNLRKSIKQLLWGAPNPIVLLTEMIAEIVNLQQETKEGGQKAIANTLDHIGQKLEEVIIQYEH